MKICVLVKEVPDAAVEKRIDAQTGRMDRSGERNLKPYDTHAIEAAREVAAGGTLASVSGLLTRELGLGVLYGALGLVALRLLEVEGRRRATMEIQ